MGQHKSTRNRCNTCKIRKVKCDETRPACLQCLKQAHICTYASTRLEYSSSVESLVDLSSLKRTGGKSAIRNDTQLKILRMTGLSIMRTPTDPCHPIVRFTLRTAPSLIPLSPEDVHQTKVLRLAHGRPYLMHAVLTVTVTHDWTIHGFNGRRAGFIQAYHMQQCATALHDRLCQPYSEDDHDALWASAALLMCASVAGTINVRPTLDDLDWIHVCRRTTNLARAWDPLRQDLGWWIKAQSCWSSVVIVGPNSLSIQELDQAIEVALTDATNNEDSALVPRDLITGLQTLLRMECRIDNIQKFLAWFATWPDSLLVNIQARQPSALLILALWCAKTCDFKWWVSHRSMTVLQGICDHFDAVCVPDSSCAALLDFCRTALEQKRPKQTGLIRCESKASSMLNSHEVMLMLLDPLSSALGLTTSEPLDIVAWEADCAHAFGK